MNFKLKMTVLHKKVQANLLKRDFAINQNIRSYSACAGVHNHCEGEKMNPPNAIIVLKRN